VKTKTAKFLLPVVGALFVFAISPLSALAQTAAGDSNSDSNSKMVQVPPARTELEQRIADLISQISVLQAQLNTLRGLSGGGIAPAATSTTDTSVFGNFGNVVSNFVQNLVPGSRGDAVSNLQRALKSDSSIYPEGLVTGYFGPLTENAVKKFQAKNNIVSGGDANSTGYGAVGPKTNAKLNNAFNYLMPKAANCADETSDANIKKNCEEIIK
jgi:peptidoglycan hydrolase-like protein with peptidoglycan-binding domain